MCSPAAFVLTKDSVFWSMHTDSHEEIIAEYGISQDGVRGPNIVRVEITPPNGDVSISDLSQWRYELDQDIRPTWYDAAECERRARVALGDWYTNRVISGVVDELAHGSFWIIGSASVGGVCGSASVGGVCGSARVERVCGSASVGGVYGSASVGGVYDSASVGSVYGSARVERVCGSARVERVCGSARVERVCGSARVGSVYGSARVERVYGSASVGGVYDSASVGSVYGYSTIRQFGGTVALPTGPHAVVIDSRGGKSVCITEV